MAVYGGQVQAINMTPDTRQSVAAARELAMTGAQGIAGMVGQVGDYFKQQGEKKKLIKKSDVQIDAALKLFPDLAPALQGYRDQLKDENLPLDDRMAIADSVSKVIDLGLGEMRNAQNTLIQQQRLQMEQAYKGAQLGLKERQVAATEFGAMQSAKPTFDLQKATITSPDGDTFEMDIPYDKKKGMFFDPDVGKYIKDINKWGFGEPSYVEGEAMPTPTSQIAPSGQINKSALSSPLRKYAQSFEEYGNKYGVDPALLAAIAEHETGGGKSSAFRNKNNAMGVSNASGPIKMESVEASIEKMASLLGRGINDGKGPYANAKSIEDIGRRYAPIGAGNDPGNLNKFWTRGVSSKYEKLATPKQIDDAISMGGDMTQQAIGTPQQQAEIARMIQEGQSMQTAQAVPRGAMGTEPSIATQQPQQAQPQFRPRSGFVPVKPQGKQKEAKIITGEEAKALNLDPLGTYEASYQDGQLTGVQTLKAAPSVGDIIAMEKREEEKAAKQQMAVATANKSERMVDLMTALKNSPGFTNLFGANWYPKGMRGTPGADAAALFKQIEALGFMEAIKDMKGMGALSDAEGQKASAAFLGISPDMSEEAAKNKIDEVIRYIQTGRERIQSGKLIETKENKGPSISGANSYFNQFNQPPAR